MRIWRRIFGPMLLLVLLAAAYIGFKFRFYQFFREEIRLELGKYITAIFLVLLGLGFHSLAGGFFSWYRIKMVGATATRLDDEFLPLIDRICKICIWILVGLLVLPLFGINISALIAALGVGSLAIALAAQDTLANIISGFMLMLDRPFRIGDKIKLPSGEVVRVLEIGVRRSKFAGEEQEVIVLPNLDLSKSKIVNYTYSKESEQAGENEI